MTHSLSTQKTKKDAYQTISDSIVDAFEQGLIQQFELPWRKLNLIQPINAFSENYYRGINRLQLWVASQKSNYQSNQWATFNQWQKKNATVKKGEKGTPIVFYSKFEHKAEGEKQNELSQDEKPKNESWFVRISYVFNAEQVEGLKVPKQEPPLIVRWDNIENFVKKTGAIIQQNGDSAFYNIPKDFIQLPDAHLFINTNTGTATEHYYSTLLHELIHWTIKPNRCNRSTSNIFGNEAYAMEELVAELGASFLCLDLGIKNLTNSWKDPALYIQDWIKVLKNNKKAIFFASRSAVNVVDYLHSLQTQQVSE